MKKEWIEVKAFLFFAPAYFTGIFIGVCILILRAFGIWKVRGMENFPTLEQKGGRGLILASNHPSLLEPITLTSLFLHWYILRPNYAPWNIAEITNYRRGLFRLMGTRLIFVDRKKTLSETRAILLTRKILKSGAVVIIFPEGGRTFKGPADQFRVGKNGKKIRVFKNGVGFLATQTQAMVLPVWVEGTDMVSPNRSLARYPMLLRLWKPVSITIGPPKIFTNGILAEQATGEIERAVLNLAA